MATLNPFDLLGDGETEDPSVFLAAQEQKLAAAAAGAKKAPFAAAGAKKAAPADAAKASKFPSKPQPPSQAGSMVTTDDDISFSWGKKKGRGGAKKEVQFYESFTYDGAEYFLYDSVYLYKEDESEPYIGKLIKIWEAVNKARKVKILWFFCPSEISNYLKHEKVLENELFLASGDGTGLANINPLEAIAGKCNVVCISKDERNRQPSVEELDMADYVFYRTFDVGSLTISDKLGEKISSIEVGFLLNKKDVQLPNENHNSKIDNPNDMAVVEKPVLLVKDVAGECNAAEPVANIGSLSVKGEEGSNLLDKSRSPPGAHDVAATELHSVSGQKTKLKSPVSEKADLIEAVTSAPNVRPSENQDCNKFKISGYVNKEKVNYGEKCVVDSGESIKDPVSSSVAADKGKSGMQKEVAGPGEALKKEKAVGNRIALEEGLSKKRKVDGAPHSSDNGKKLKPDGRGPGTDNARNGTPQSAAVSSDINKALPPAAAVPAETSSKGKLAKEFDGGSNENSEMLKSHGMEQNKSSDKLCKASLKSGKALEVKEHGTSNALSKKMKSDGMEVKSNGKLSNDLPKRLKSDGVIKDKSDDKLRRASLKQSKNLEIEAYGFVKEVIRRPPADKEKYYTSVDSRMKIAQEQGTLVLLQNLDPTYTSSEVEDIVYCAFGEICSAKMVQCTATSSRHSGQAFVIFKTHEAAERVIMKLNQECLILSNLRPLVAISGTLSSPEKQPSFPGHLSIIDKLKHQSHQTQRESREAVSTSHCSQPNTLEYELALEWRLLQDRSDLCWRKLYKQQSEELKRLKKSFKSKK